MPLDAVREVFAEPKVVGQTVNEAKLSKMLIQFDTSNIVLIYSYDDDGVQDKHVKINASEVPGLEPKINGMMNGIHNHIKAQL
jgi:hypothetical protein